MTVMDYNDLIITGEHDKPKSGMWHCGPNAAWVTVKHIPTQISARAYHKHQWKAREMALACVAIMVEDCGVDHCQFPETVAGDLP